MGIWRIEKNSEERNLFGEKRNLLNLSKKDFAFGWKVIVCKMRYATFLGLTEGYKNTKYFI